MAGPDIEGSQPGWMSVPAPSDQRSPRFLGPDGTALHDEVGGGPAVSVRDQGEYSRKDVEYSAFGGVRLDGYFDLMFSAPQFTARKVMSQAIGRLFRGMARQSWGLAK